MATITVNIYPVQDCFSEVVYRIGAPFGGVTYDLLHAQICIETSGISCCYDLRQDGVNSSPLGTPTVAYSWNTTAKHAAAMLQRIGWYREMGYRVTFMELMSALLYPQETYWGLCTSFVDFVIYGRIDKLSNRMDTFLTRINSEASYNAHPAT